MTLISSQDILSKLESALNDMQATKQYPQRTSDAGRYLAISITELEKAMACYKVFVADAEKIAETPG